MKRKLQEDQTLLSLKSYISIFHYGHFPSPLWLIVSTSKYFLKIISIKVCLFPWPWLSQMVYFMLSMCPPIVCTSCIYYALNCVACHAYHTFLEPCLNACLLWIFWCLDFAERNEDLSTVEAPTSPFCQRQVAYS